jgi:hypothetical protein
MPSQVPDLTRSRDIKLKERVLLRDQSIPIRSYHRTIAPTSGPTVAKPSVEHIPAGGFVVPKARLAGKEHES